MGDFILTLLLGWLGVHRFKKGQTVLGFVYLFTLGIGGIGWGIDTIIALIKYINSRNTSTVTDEEISFFVSGTYYHTEDIKKVLKPAQYSDFLYRIREDVVELVPEPTNPHDKNAIKILMDGVLIGYVPADLCLKVMPQIGKKTFVATISGGATHEDSTRSFKIHVVERREEKVEES